MDNKMIKEMVLDILRRHIKEIKRFHIEKISIFGSVARDQETPHSDIDILIKFDGPASYDLFMDLKFFLEDLLNRKVDLVTEDAIRSEIKKYIEKDLIRVA